VVLPRGDRLEALVDGDLIAAIPYSTVEISVGGVDDKYLVFVGVHDGQQVRLLVADRELAAHVEAIGAPRAVVDQLREATRTRTRRKAGRWTALVVVAGLLVALALLLWAAFGWAVDKLVDEIPPEWEVELGRSVAADLLAEHRACGDPAVNQAVQEIGRRLVVGVGASRYQWRIRVLDNEDVNAFALPGGYVFVNRGLIDAADDGSQVAGVLAHELRHVIARHGIHNLVREVGLMLILYAVVGDSGAVEQFLAANAANMASMSFSRDQEREADEGGMRIVYAAGLDPTGLVRFMQQLATEESAIQESLTILSSHPASAERAAELTELMAELGQPQVTPLVSDWSAIKGRCSPISITDPDQP
jgi:Zn-dependent protease with chaperone function